MPANRLPSLIELEQAADCLRSLGHPTRLRMLLLLDSDEYNVGQLADSCGVSSHMASEHLRLMERCGLLSRNRVGKKTFYHIAKPGLRDMLDCIFDGSGQTGRKRKKP